jgi:hypothetical protein
MNKNNIDEETLKKNATSIALNLETLSVKYDNLLKEYNQIQADYIDYLNRQAKNTCTNFTSNSKNISQTCYDYLWSRSGCTTKAPNANTNWAKNQTLNGLIYDSFLWATMTDDTHRKGCYGNSTNFSKATSADYNINTPELTTITGKTFWGTGQATSTSTSEAKTLNECKALCSSEAKCTGATFNATSHGRPICWLRTGEGNISNGLKEDVAIVSKKMMYLNRMKEINSQLQNINKQISNLIATKGENIYKNQVNMRKNKSTILQQNQIQLSNQYNKISSEIDQYESIYNEETEQSLKVKQNYAIYGLMAVIAIIALIIVGKMSVSAVANNSSGSMIQTGGTLSNKTYYGVFVVILIAVIINIIYN